MSKPGTGYPEPKFHLTDSYMKAFRVQRWKLSSLSTTSQEGALEHLTGSQQRWEAMKYKDFMTVLKYIFQVSVLYVSIYFSFYFLLLTFYVSC